MNKKLEEKLKLLPRSPGVYLHKNKSGEIIYVGKAAILKNRVRHYFQNTKLRDIKTNVLIAEIADVDWLITESEIDALFLESELVKRYKPRYNILLRDDKSQIFVRINMKDPYPYLSFTRQPADDKAEYYGPYYNGFAVKKALRYLRRSFPYSTHVTMPRRVCLQYHLGLCPGVEEHKMSSEDYKKILRRLISYLKGEREKLVKQLQSEMQKAAKAKDFELAAERRDQIRNLKELQKQILFSDREFLDISKDEALVGLAELLHLEKAPKRIEGYDISHMSGQHNVASMVVATNGVPDKTEYRKFKMQLPGNNDFAHMNEVISRRFSGKHTTWAKPDLLLIDGGKGQVGAAAKALKDLGVNIPLIGLAKRLEVIIVPRQSGEFEEINLPNNSHIVKLLQRIRDESHRFAVSYHTVLKRKNQTKNELEEIPGIGPLTRKKLIRHFGSLKALKEADIVEIESVIGKAKAKVINMLRKK